MRLRLLATLLPAAIALPMSGQQAGGVELFASRDADHAVILKSGAIFDFSHVDAEHYRGIKVELAHFAPSGGIHRNAGRVYYRFAGTGAVWKWNGSAGTDGHTALGDASVFKEGPRRQEYFVERELLETRLGLQRGLHHTFAGAAYDIPIDSRTLVTALGGLQEFSGGNVRMHLRGRFIRVVDEQHGVSVQLRTRYFYSTRPGQFDYYSPRYYADAVPVVQVRRFAGGWRFQAAAGLGEQRDSFSSWRAARLIEGSMSSPEKGRRWWFKTALTYTNTPVNSAYTYRYVQLTAQVMRRFGQRAGSRPD